MPAAWVEAVAVAAAAGGEGGELPGVVAGGGDGWAWAAWVALASGRGLLVAACTPPMGSGIVGQAVSRASGLRCGARSRLGRRRLCLGCLSLGSLSLDLLSLGLLSLLTRRGFLIALGAPPVGCRVEG